MSDLTDEQLEWEGDEDAELVARVLRHVIATRKP